MIDRSHIAYEFQMARLIAARLPTVVDQFTFNVYQEAFWLHVYNLMQVFHFGSEPLYEKIVNQVITLTDKREIDMSKRLQRKDIEEIAKTVAEQESLWKRNGP